MKVALVYDRINKWGGAERVLLSLHKLYPDAPLYTLVHNPETSSWAGDIKVTSSFINRIPFLRTNHEWLAPVATLGFESFNFDSFDVVISVTSADAKSVITKPHTLHICYCLTPTRYFWGGTSDYIRDMKIKILPKIIYNHLRSADEIYSTRPDYYFAISKEVSNRLLKHYHQNSEIIYPAIDDKFYSNTLKNGYIGHEYYLLVSRLVSYKKVDLAISTFNQSGKSLYIVGTGRMAEKLKAVACPNIKFLGAVSDSELLDYYTNAKAVIFPQSEDFGLVPIEAQARGTPVIAFAGGGALETVIDSQTGLFFHKQTSVSLSRAISDFEAGRHQITPEKCIFNARKFNEVGFINNFSAKVDSLWQKHQKTLM